MSNTTCMTMQVKADELEISDRDWLIYLAVSEGSRSNIDIGQEFGLHRNTIRKIADAVADQLAPYFQRRVHQLKVTQTTQLRFLAQKAVTGYETSRKVGKQPGGEARFLDVARKCYADIRAIWGAEAPKRVDADVDIKMNLSPSEQLRQINENLERLLQKRVVAQVAPVTGQRDRADADLSKPDDPAPPDLSTAACVNRVEAE